MAEGLSLVGVNLSGAEFGNASGQYGWSYIYPNRGEIDYYAAKGVNVIRLPFLWERMQPTLGGALDSAELARMDAVVQYATSKGVSVILDPHDYGGYKGNLIGSAAVPDSAFADFWAKLAAHYQSAGNVIFGLMNEPNKQSATNWLHSENAAIAAIRATGASQEVLVQGSYWDGGWTWTTSDNARVIGTGIVDSANNYAFEVHQYFDQWSSGSSTQVVSPTVGVDRLTAITQWAGQHNARLFLGEFGVGQDAASLAASQNMLTYMSQHADVWQGATEWGGGPWWGNYMFSVEPSNGVDKPQLALLASFTPAARAAAATVVPLAAPVVPMQVALVSDTGASASDGLTQVAAIAGTGAANTAVSLTVDGIAVSANLVADATGAWSYSLAGLADGAHTIVASQPGAATAAVSFRLDTTAPTPTLSGSGGPVTAATQTIQGTGEVGGTITLFDGPTAVTPALAVANDGTWSTSITMSFGTHVFTAKSTDAAGNTGTSPALTYVYNPAPVLAALLSDTGASASDGITQLATIAGTGAANTAVSLTVDGITVLGNLVADATGAWSYSPAGLAEGVHTIVASQPGAAAAAVSFQLDTTAPTPMLSGSGGSVSSAAQVIQGTGEPDGTVTLFDGTTAVAPAIAVAADGTWSAGVTMTAGTHVLTAKSTDVAGNTGTSPALTYVFDPAPVVPVEAMLSSDTGASTSDGITQVAAIAGTGAANTAVSLTVDGIAVAENVVADATGAWSYSPAGLADGVHTIMASQPGAAAAVVSFRLDTTAPTPTLSGSGGSVSSAAQMIQGTGEAGGTVILLDGATVAAPPVTVAADGTWSASVTMSPGTHVFTATSTDAAGNVGTSQALTYTYNHAPVMTSGAGIYVVGTSTRAIATIRATDADPGDVVSYGLRGADGAPAASTGLFAIDPTTGDLSFTNTPRAGIYSVTTIATDAYGAATQQTNEVKVGPNLVRTGTSDDGMANTFVIDAASSLLTVVQNFRVADATVAGGTDPHGVLALAHTLFNGVTAGASGDAAASVLASHSLQFGTDTLIVTDTHHVIDLQNTNRVALLAHPADFAFT